MEYYRILKEDKKNKNTLLYLMKDDGQTEKMGSGDYIIILGKYTAVVSAERGDSVQIESLNYKELCINGKIVKVSKKFFHRDVIHQYELKNIKQNMEVLKQKTNKEKSDYKQLLELKKQYKKKTVAMEKSLKKEMKKMKKEDRKSR